MMSFHLPILNGTRRPFLSPYISPETPFEMASAKPARRRKPSGFPPPGARRAARAAGAAPAAGLPPATRLDTRAH
ncbi:hypothetical protein X946_4723 [Burkholderia sp. ABCPW 111]|nr:hypothetical protein X946_4723 [Burkholderia sp. ABCPW 111]